jgi:hypothetical protein
MRGPGGNLKKGDHMFKKTFLTLPLIISLSPCNAMQLPCDHKSSSDDDADNKRALHFIDNDGPLILVMPQSAELCDIFKRFGVSTDFLALTEIHNELGGKELSIWGLEILKTRLLLDYAEKLKAENQDSKRVLLERMALDAAISSLLYKNQEAFEQDQIIRKQIKNKILHPRKRAAKPIFHKN